MSESGDSCLLCGFDEGHYDWEFLGKSPKEIALMLQCRASIMKGSCPLLEGHNAGVSPEVFQILQSTQGADGFTSSSRSGHCCTEECNKKLAETAERRKTLWDFRENHADPTIKDCHYGNRFLSSEDHNEQRRLYKLAKMKELTEKWSIDPEFGAWLRDFFSKDYP
jgi:hypothetical protein